MYQQSTVQGYQIIQVSFAVSFRNISVPHNYLQVHENRARITTVTVQIRLNLIPDSLVPKIPQSPGSHPCP